MRELGISYGRSCHEKMWTNDIISFEALIDRLMDPVRTLETVDKYSKLKASCPLKDAWDALAARHKRKSTIAVHVANKMLSIGWVLLRKKELYSGFGDYSRLERKLREEKMSAIDTSMFPELN